MTTRRLRVRARVRLHRWRARRRLERRWPSAKRHPEAFVTPVSALTASKFRAMQTTVGIEPTIEPGDTLRSEDWHAVMLATARPHEDVIDADIWNAIASYAIRRQEPHA